MVFKRPFPLINSGRGRTTRSLFSSTGISDTQVNKAYVSGLPFITVNRPKRSRSRTKYSGKQIRGNEGVHSDTNTDSDYILSEDDTSIGLNRILENNDNENQVDLTKPSTSKQGGNKRDEKGSQFQDLKFKEVKKIDGKVEESIQIEHTYSKVLKKDIQDSNNKEEIEVKPYNDIRAEFFLKRGVWFTRNREVNFGSYIKEIEKITGKDSITDIQLIRFNKVELYLKTEEQATDLAVNGIMLNGKLVRFFHMTKHPIKLFISGIKSWIKDFEIIQALGEIGFCDQKSLQSINVKDNGQDTQIKCGVRIINLCRRPDVPLPKSVKLHINGDIHQLEIVSEFIVCRNCDEPGHLVRNCLKPPKTVMENENYITEFPELKTKKKEENNMPNEVSKNEINMQNELKIHTEGKFVLNKNILEEVKNDYNNENQDGKMFVEENEVLGNMQEETIMKVLETDDLNSLLKEEKRNEEVKDIDEYAKDLYKKEQIMIDKVIRVEVEKMELGKIEQLDKRGTNEEEEVYIQILESDKDENGIDNKISHKDDNIEENKEETLLIHFDELEQKLLEGECSMNKLKDQEQEKGENENIKKPRTRKRRKLSSKEEQTLLHSESISSEDISNVNQEQIDKYIEQNMEIGENELFERMEDENQQNENITDKQVITKMELEVGKIEKKENENIQNIEKMLKDNQEHIMSEIVVLKNIEESHIDDEVQQSQDKGKDKGLEIRNWMNYEQDLQRIPEIIKFVKIMNDAYKRRRANKKVYLDKVMATFKLHELIQTIIDYAETYDAYGKLGEVQHMITAKLKYDKEVKIKLTRQKVTAASIANSLGYPVEVEIEISKIKYWQENIQMDETRVEKDCIEELNKVEAYIQARMVQGSFPEDDMKEIDYRILGNVIYRNISYYRKFFKLKMMLTRLQESYIGKVIVNKWEEKIKKKIKKFTDVSEFKELNAAQKKVVGISKK